MPNVFDGPPDARQSDDTNLKTSLFRPRYRALTSTEMELHDALKTKADELAVLIGQVPPGRYKALALTELETSIMWAVKAVTA